MKNRLFAFSIVVACLQMAGFAARETCDVLVVGGGSAGIAAALQAGRAGASTVLVERGSQVGGNMTTGGVNFPGLFHAEGRQIIDGCAYEILTNAAALSGFPLPDFAERTVPHWKHQIRVEIPVYVAVAEEALTRAGVELRYHMALSNVKREDGVWHCVLCADGVMSQIAAKVLVDCTGDGTLSALAGAKRMRDSITSPGSFIYSFENGHELWERCDKPKLANAFEVAMETGELECGDAVRGLRAIFEGTPGTSWNYVPDADTSTAEKRTDTNMRGRASMLRLYRFLRRQPGLEDLRLGTVSAEVGVRETWRVEGDYVISHEDYVSGRQFEDAVCYAYYPVDLHSVEGGVRPRQLPRGVVPTVPFRALCVKDVPNLLVAGRCISADRLAASGLRVQGSCMAMGQVAGQAAALAAAKGCDVREVQLHELRTSLKASRALTGVLPVPVTVVGNGPLSVWTNDSGRVIHDFRQDAFGWVEACLASEQTAPVAAIEVLLGEKLDGCGVDMEPSGSVRAARCSVEGLSPKSWQRVPIEANERNTGGRAVKMPPEIGVVMPFRYVETPIGVDVRRMSVAVPMDMSASSFTCSDDRLNEVYEFCKYTILATSFAGLYVDGDRERIPYEADAYINMLGEQAVWADGRMARATMRHLLDNPTWPTEWQLHMPMMAHGYWMATGDIEPIRANYGRLKELLLRDRAREGDGLLVTEWERNGHFWDIVDWPNCERDGFVFTSVNSVVNAFHIRALRDMARLSSALGEEDEANAFASEAEVKTRAFRAAFVDEKAGLVRDGVGVAHSSIHANIAAVAFGLLPETVRGRVMEHVRSRGMACSTYFSQYLLEACFAAGYGRYARALMTSDGDRSWLGMKKAGATMCMESWSGAVKPNQDWNHAWSTAPLNIVSRFVLGVRVLEPGARKVLIEPDLCGMDFAEGVVPSARGPVKVSASGSSLVVETPVPTRVVWRGNTHEVAAGKHNFK